MLSRFNETGRLSGHALSSKLAISNRWHSHEKRLVPNRCAMKHLTLDVQVVMSGSGKGDPPHHAASLALMETIANGSARVVVDNQGLIVRHYSEKLGTSEYGRYWMQRLADVGRVVPVPRA